MEAARPVYALTPTLQAAQGGPTVVINELHTNPDVATELIEYVELHNWGRSTVNLSGWSFSSGVFFTFADGTTIPPGGYLVVAENPDQLLTKWTILRANLADSQVFGPYGGKLNNDGERVTLRDAAGRVVDEVDYQLGFPWPTVGDEVPEGHSGSGYSMQLMNPLFDNDLGGAWRSSSPTPAARNVGVFRDTAPPFVRQVEHTPRQPKSSDVVTITAKVTDLDGVDAVKLSYQPVAPGAYIARKDSAYQALWIMLDMHDDGLDGDAAAGDDVYSVRMPADVQINRMLVRYRLFVVDSVGDYVQLPYPDDPQPNFAYFVYDGVPPWQGAIRPGAQGAMGQVVEYSPEVMRSLPVYHLISKNSDVETCTWRERYGGSDYKWQGTLVYDGEVYDHIRYRARGGVWRYAMGKNMWKFDFNRGHSFQARDDYGRPYDTKWDKINFSACIQQGDYQHRGEQGIFEAAAFRLFNLMGCEAPKTSWVHFRIIDAAEESGPTQYDGDFWGLYMNIEQMDGRFLDEHNLPDGNLYKIEGYSGELNNQGPTAATNRSDLNQFMSGYRSRPPEPWWHDNVNLDGYYAYRCVVEGVHHGDIGYGKNWFFYLNPETNKWSMLPWDVDLTWANNMYGNGEDDFKSSGRIFSNPNIDIEYRNRLREFHDLLYNADQAYQMLDDLADIIDFPGGGPTFVDADRAMWDYHPIMTSGYVNSGKAGQGRFYQRAATKDFRGMVQIMKDYIVSNNREFDTYTEDPAAPQTPVVTPTAPAGFPANALTFTTTPFSDPQGAGTFAAMKWRIAEVRPGAQAVQPSGGGSSSGYVFVPEGSQWRYFKGLAEPSTTPGAWRQRSFNDSDWLVGTTPLGYGESFLATVLGDMRYAYTSLYLRKTFNATGLDAFDKLLLSLRYDDGVNIWINGTLVFQDNVPGADLPYDATALSAIEMLGSAQYEIGAPADLLVNGTNVIAIQVLNADLFSSSDCFIEASLTAEKAADSGGDDPTAPASLYRGTPGKYEIEAAWQSDDLTTLDADVKIPASVVRSGRTYRVRCRMKDDTGRWSHWSAPVQFEAGEPIAAGILADLRVTELMYNPADPPAADATGNDEFEFIELKNTGDETLDLTSVSIANGVTFDFAGSAVTTLGPGQFVLVVRNSAAFLSRYGTGLASLIAGEYGGKFANEGETVHLVDFWNGTIAEFTYGDGRGWPVAADGAGHSLVPLASAVPDEPWGSLEYGGNWRASAFIGGSPGQDDPDPGATVVLNELMASDDWIELYNPTLSAVDLAGWFLSDDARDLSKWAIPARPIPAHGYLSFDQGAGLGFGLSRAGEQLLLSYLPGAGPGRVADAVTFKAQEGSVSLGRYPDGASYWFRLAPSRNAANADPIADVVIDEIMYHPVDPNDEYIELYNPTNAAVTLASTDGMWRLAGGAEYALPAGVTIPAGGRLVLVGFDPQVETARLSAFVAAYGSGPLTAGVTILGPWQGNLANGGERVALEKPQATGDVNDPIAWVVVDEVIYGDVSPWPATADGQGDALQRLTAAPTQSGNDPANWQAAAPTPGLAP